jgi:hypothetical protein
MNADIKQKWIEALRSGEFKQGTLALRSADNHYCCLGVLCELAARQGVVETKLTPNAHWYLYGEEIAGLTDEVRAWAGIEDDNPLVAIPGYVTLTHLNDSKGYSFDTIAAIIEEHL